MFLVRSGCFREVPRVFEDSGSVRRDLWVHMRVLWVLGKVLFILEEILEVLLGFLETSHRNDFSGPGEEVLRVLHSELVLLGFFYNVPVSK